MKLDKIKFAKLVAHCVSNGMSAGDWEVEKLEELCDIDVTPVEVPGKANPADVDALMAAIHQGKRIEAIKAYRILTGVGLKEAKDAVEKEWNSKQEAMIKSIEAQLDCVPSDYILEKFNGEQLKLVKGFIKSFY